MFVALGIDTMFAWNRRISYEKRPSKENGEHDTNKVTKKRLDGAVWSAVSLWIYAIAMVIPLTTGIQLLSATLVVFVPLVRFYLLSYMALRVDP